MVEEHVFSYNNPFLLESGETLPGFQLHYTTYGRLNEARDNVVWVCHALTANAHVLDWWPGLFGPDRLYNPEEHFVVCANMLGSCYGSTGPLSESPTGEPFYHEFPTLTNRDIVRSFEQLRQHLGVKRLHTLIGGSMGGQQALEWTIMQPNLVRHLVQIASNAQHSPWGIAFNESQRMAIEHDASWPERSSTAGLGGLRTARSVALLSYRHYRTYADTQSEKTNEKIDNFRASSYQRYQGEKLAHRFNAFSYWVLSEAMDSHHIGRGRGSVAEVLKSIRTQCLFIGIDTDVLFPSEEQEFLARNTPSAHLSIVASSYGHDGFLIETSALTQVIRSFYSKTAHIVI